MIFIYIILFISFYLTVAVACNIYNGIKTYKFSIKCGNSHERAKLDAKRESFFPADMLWPVIGFCEFLSFLFVKTCRFWQKILDITLEKRFNKKQ